MSETVFGFMSLADGEYTYASYSYHQVRLSNSIEIFKNVLFG